MTARGRWRRNGVRQFIVGTGGRALHENSGYILGTAGALFLVLPALARTGAPTIVPRRGNE